MSNEADTIFSAIATMANGVTKVAREINYDGAEDALKMALEVVERCRTKKQAAAMLRKAIKMLDDDRAKRGLSPRPKPLSPGPKPQSYCPGCLGVDGCGC